MSPVSEASGVERIVIHHSALLLNPSITQYIILIEINVPMALRADAIGKPMSNSLVSTRYSIRHKVM